MSTKDRLLSLMRSPLSAATLRKARDATERRLRRVGLHPFPITQRDKLDEKHNFILFVEEGELRNSLSLARGDIEEISYSATEIVLARQLLLDFNSDADGLPLSAAVERIGYVLAAIDLIKDQYESVDHPAMNRHVCRLLEHCGYSNVIELNAGDGEEITELAYSWLLSEMERREATQLRLLGTERSPDISHLYDQDKGKIREGVPLEERLSIESIIARIHGEIAALVDETRPSNSDLDDAGGSA